MKLQIGDVVLLRMEFHQTGGGKVRPAILLDAGDADFVAAPVTSRPRLSEYDLPVEEWKEAGLNVPSFIRIHKRTVLPKNGIVRNLGSLTKADRAALTRILARAFRASRDDPA
jgi:mRNA interferase MazF